MVDDQDAARPPPTEAVGRRLAATLVGGTLVLGLVIGGILLLRGDADEQTDYDEAVAERFLSVCTQDAADLGFAAPAEFCRCSYERIVAEIPFDRFVQMDAAMREDPGAVPDEIDRIRTDCFVGTAPTPPPTTAAPAGG